MFRMACFYSIYIFYSLCTLRVERDREKGAQSSRQIGQFSCSVRMCLSVCVCVCVIKMGFLPVPFQ